MGFVQKPEVCLESTSEDVRPKMFAWSFFSCDFAEELF